MASVRSGPDGRFFLALGAGNYTLEVVSAADGFCKPVSVTIPDGGVAQVTLSCDTGIR